MSDVATRSARALTSEVFLTPRIVGGTVVGGCSTYPWMVRITVDRAEVCGGAILDATHILTAAHCVVNKNSLRVVVGEDDALAQEGTEQVFDVDVKTQAVVNPTFSLVAQTNDVAVVTLDKPIDLSKPCATPICMDKSYTVKSGQTCTVAGWGATDENSRQASQRLQSVSLPTFQGTDCSTVFPGSGANYLRDPTNQLCAGQPNVGGVDACGGDSGGPLVCLDDATQRWVVVGVVSYGEGCARPNFPGVYAKVSSYYDWIQDQLKS